jgi:antitoxin component HigA of HigAB toxin-antitoxin module
LGREKAEENMTNDKSTFETYVENPERRRIFEQERLMVDATELLFTAMELRRTKKADLAQKLGRSKAYVTQMLRGNQNLTLRTLADVFCVLNCRLLLAADTGAGMIASRRWNMSQRAGNAMVDNEYTTDEFIGGMAA